MTADNIQTRALHVALTRGQEPLFLFATGGPSTPLLRAQALLEIVDDRRGAAA